MLFVLFRAAARCQGRRLLAAAATAPLPAAIVLTLVAGAPVALARVGALLGNELAPSGAASGVASALVLGPCLASAAAGGAIAASLSRSELGQQVAAGPCGERAAIVAPLLLPALLAAVVVLPSLVALTVSLTGPLPGGHAAGLALSVAVLASIPVGAIAAEAGRSAARGSGRRLLALIFGAGAWVAVGGAMGIAVLGPLAPVGLALRGAVSPWIALATACGVAVGVTGVWFGGVSGSMEPRPPRVRQRRFAAAWRYPCAAAVSALVTRRADVRWASVASLGFGLTGVVVAAVAGSAPPGPFLLATTTTLLGSLVAGLALFGILAAGAWLWLGAPSRLRSLAVSAWLVGLTAAATPVVVVGIVAAVASGVDASAAGVVSILVVLGAALAMISGSVVPWRNDGIGDQLSTVAAFMALALATSFAIGLTAPRLAALGLPDPGVAVLLCGVFSLLAAATLTRRLGEGRR